MVILQVLFSRLFNVRANVLNIPQAPVPATAAEVMIVQKPESSRRRSDYRHNPNADHRTERAIDGDTARLGLL